MRLGRWNDADTLILNDSHLDMEWIQDFELPKAHSQHLSLSYTWGLLQLHSPITFPTWWCLWATVPNAACENYPHPFAAGTREVCSSFCRLCPAGNTILRVASPIFSKGFLHSKLSVGSSNPCPLFPLIDAVTMLSWVKLIHMKARDTLHKWITFFHSTGDGG